ncbi:transcription factor Opi1-domain-containing protein [Lentinula aff. detonsa]|uniref:Transcription factor Opi1-domain-containing protein n=1 Tax=Lentinula aff. detonsa TaxID=2804958 RepID=A0AA38K7P2_9AGAR|nr:transcription factor Opi1-domain-containing protein [Lentinula aff. detonsa]
MDDSSSQSSIMPSESSPRLGHSTQSSMSLASSSTLLDEQDEDVRIAVKALGDMRSGNIGGAASRQAPLSTSPKSTTSTPSPILSSDGMSNNDAHLEPDFVSRMAHIPLVNGAIRMYEQGKASSRVVKYGAEIMETGVKTISRPVIDRLPTGQLDDFACRQLDRLDRYRRPSQDASDRQDQEEMQRLLHSPTYGPQEDLDAKEREDEVGRWVKMTSSGSSNLRSPTPTRSSDLRVRHDANVDPSSTRGISSDPFHFSDNSSYILGSDDQRRRPPSYTHAHDQQPQDNQQQQVVQRSRWQTMLLEAGGFSVAWSEESMRKLRYVLQWLQYATNHIDQQILAIRDFTEALQQHYFEASPLEPTIPTDHSLPSLASTRGGHSRSASGSQSQTISSAHRHKLNSIQRDVTQTVRNVVTVVSKYGGNAALPEPARNAVKAFILQLPKKVRESMRIGGDPPDIHASISMSPAGSSSNDGTSVAAAASGRAGRRAAARRSTRGDRGLGGSWSAAASPMSSRATSPAASPRTIPSRTLNSATSSISGPNGEDDGASGLRNTAGHTMSAGTAFMTAKRILTLATESLDMMRGVTAVVQESLERADAWIERLKTVGIHREDGSSNTPIGSDRPHSPSTNSTPEMDRSHMNLTLDSSMMQHAYRGRNSDSGPLSPASVAMNLGSRRNSLGSSAGFNFAADSLPSTPGLVGYPSGPYGPSTSSYNGPSMDGPGPEVGMSLRRMSIRGSKGENVDVKKEEQEVKMEVDG